MPTRERKLYAGILGLAAIGLAADKLFLGASGPAAASASVQPSEPPAAAETAAPRGDPRNAPGAKAEAAARPSLADRLRSAAAAIGPSRSISHTPEWLVPPAAPQQIGAAPVPSTASGSPVAPIARIQLSATLGDGDRPSAVGPAAVIDGRLVRVGEEFQRMRLVAVGRGTAVFAAGQSLWQVTAEDPVPRLLDAQGQ